MQWTEFPRFSWQRPWFWLEVNQQTTRNTDSRVRSGNGSGGNGCGSVAWWFEFQSVQCSASPFKRSAGRISAVCIVRIIQNRRSCELRTYSFVCALASLLWHWDIIMSFWFARGYLSSWYADFCIFFVPWLPGRETLQLQTATILERSTHCRRFDLPWHSTCFVDVVWLPARRTRKSYWEGLLRPRWFYSGNNI